MVKVGDMIKLIEPKGEDIIRGFKENHVYEVIQVLDAGVNIESETGVMYPMANFQYEVIEPTKQGKVLEDGSSFELVDTVEVSYISLINLIGKYHALDYMIEVEIIEPVNYRDLKGKYILKVYKEQK